MLLTNFIFGSAVDASTSAAEVRSASSWNDIGFFREQGVDCSDMSLQRHDNYFLELFAKGLGRAPTLNDVFQLGKLNLPEYVQKYLLHYATWLLTLRVESSLHQDVKDASFMLFSRNVFDNNSLENIVGVLEPVPLARSRIIKDDLGNEVVLQREVFDAIERQLDCKLFQRVLPVVRSEGITLEEIVHGLLDGKCLIAGYPITAHGFSSKFAKMPTVLAATHDHFHYQNFLINFEGCISNWIFKQLGRERFEVLSDEVDRLYNEAISRWERFTSYFKEALAREKKKMDDSTTNSYNELLVSLFYLLHESPGLLDSSLLDNPESFDFSVLAKEKSPLKDLPYFQDSVEATKRALTAKLKQKLSTLRAPKEVMSTPNEKLDEEMRPIINELEKIQRTEYIILRQSELAVVFTQYDPKEDLNPQERTIPTFLWLRRSLFDSYFNLSQTKHRLADQPTEAKIDSHEAFQAYVDKMMQSLAKCAEDANSALTNHSAGQAQN